MCWKEVSLTLPLYLYLYVSYLYTKITVDIWCPRVDSVDT